MMQWLGFNKLFFSYPFFFLSSPCQNKRVSFYLFFISNLVFIFLLLYWFFFFNFIPHHLVLFNFHIKIFHHSLNFFCIIFLIKFCFQFHLSTFDFKLFFYFRFSFHSLNCYFFCFESFLLNFILLFHPPIFYWFRILFIIIF
jgi:hypothetical protein